VQSSSCPPQDWRCWQNADCNRIPVPLQKILQRCILGQCNGPSDDDFRLSSHCYENRLHQSTVIIAPIDIAKFVVSWLREQDDWLLVIDNLVDVTVVDGYLPDSTTGGHTLITTRNPNSDGIPAAGIEIGVLSKDEAIDPLCLRSKLTEYYDADVEEKIVCEVGYLLPLKLQHIYVKQTEK